MPNFSHPFSLNGVNRKFFRGLARAFGGAIVFALPILMTLEMWSLGPSIQSERLALLVLLTVPILTGMSHFAGFEETFNWREDLLDAFGALAVGLLVSAVVLAMLGIFSFEMPFAEAVGLVTLQGIASSLGAMLGVSQFGDEQEKAREERRKREADFWGTIFFMSVGTLVLTFAIAPTEEVILIANRLLPWQLFVLTLVSLLIMHGFVHAEQRQKELGRTPDPTWKLFLRFTVPGYAVSLIVTAAVLWGLGRLDGLALEPMVATVVVLGFPAAVGAGAAHLIF